MSARAHASLSFAALAVALAACTVFDGVTLPVDSSPGGASPGGGAGGAGAGGSSSSSSTGGALPYTKYVDPPTAAKLCGFAQDSAFAASLILSTGLPIGQATSNVDVEVNQSVCISILAGPLPANQIGVTERRSVLTAAASANTAAGATFFLPVVVFDPNSKACATGSHCIGDVAIACDEGKRSLDCRSDLFDGAACDRTAKACAGSVACADAPKSCDGDVGAVCDAATHLASPVDCASLGLHCVDGACATASQGALTCSIDEVATSACAPGSSTSTLNLCLGAIEVDVDCAGIPATCVEGTPVLSGGAFCKGPGVDCAPGDVDVDTCKDSTNLVTCVAGTKTTIDCGMIGAGFGCSAGSCQPM